MDFVKSLFIMIASLFSGIFADKSEIAERPVEPIAAKLSLYDFKVKSLVGDETVDLSKYKGKKVVILNVASKCGYTKQYADWEKFNKDHGDKVVVLGFPANNFGGQEPGTSEEIATFCSKTYGVTFPMFEKVSVLGEDQAPIYKWLTSKDLNGWNDKVPTWNFCKYVVNENGQLTNFFASKILPTDPEFLKAVGI
jgi:glutathione peroxidase